VHAQAVELRLAELVAALSVATDLGGGQPIGHGQRAGVIAARLGEAARVAEADRRDAYYLAMLRYIGCTAGAHVVAEVMGDEIAISSWFATINQGEPPEAVAALVRNIGSGLPPWQRFNALLTAFTGLPGLARMGQAAHCEVATNLTARLGLGTDLAIRPARLDGALGRQGAAWSPER